MNNFEVDLSDISAKTASLPRDGITQYADSAIFRIALSK